MSGAEQYVSEMEEKNLASFQRLLATFAKLIEDENFSPSDLLRLEMKAAIEATEIAALWLSGAESIDEKIALGARCGDTARHYTELRNRLAETPEQILHREGEREYVAAPAIGLADRLHEQAGRRARSEGNQRNRTAGEDHNQRRAPRYRRCAERARRLVCHQSLPGKPCGAMPQRTGNIEMRPRLP